MATRIGLSSPTEKLKEVK